MHLELGLQQGAVLAGETFSGTLQGASSSKTGIDLICQVDKCDKLLDDFDQADHDYHKQTEMTAPELILYRRVLVVDRPTQKVAFTFRVPVDAKSSVRYGYQRCAWFVRAYKTTNGTDVDTSSLVAARVQVCGMADEQTLQDEKEFLKQRLPIASESNLKSFCCMDKGSATVTVTHVSKPWLEGLQDRIKVKAEIDNRQGRRDTNVKLVLERKVSGELNPHYNSKKTVAEDASPSVKAGAKSNVELEIRAPNKPQSLPFYADSFLPSVQTAQLTIRYQLKLLLRGGGTVMTTDIDIVYGVNGLDASPDDREVVKVEKYDEEVHSRVEKKLQPDRDTVFRETTSRVKYFVTGL